MPGEIVRRSRRCDVLLDSQPDDFRRAAVYVLTHKTAIPMTSRLMLYALHKQSTAGDAPEAPANLAQTIELAKHTARSRVRGVPAAEARKR